MLPADPSLNNNHPILTAGHEPSSTDARHVAGLLREIISNAEQTEANSASASNAASMVVMNVRIVSGMMGENAAGDF